MSRLGYALDVALVVLTAWLVYDRVIQGGSLVNLAILAVCCAISTGVALYATNRERNRERNREKGR